MFIIMKIAVIFSSLSTVHIYDFHIFTVLWKGTIDEINQNELSIHMFKCKC